MAWKFENPLYTMTDEEQNQRARDVWEGENLGGIAENNNRLPQPVVWLLGLTIITAFLITAPLWGQRPNAAMFQEYVALMDSSEVQAIADPEKKMEFIFNKVKAEGSKWQPLLDRHQIEWDDLEMIKDKVIELEKAGVDLQEYNILGDRVELANFEGAVKPNGQKARVQPWWDKGYTIDVFYVSYFCIALIIVVKRLPNFEWQPDHSKAH